MWRSWDDRRSRKARLLLRPAIGAAMGGAWADFGCGDGIFTRLLVEWLTPGSTIVAIDRDDGALRRLVQGLSAQAARAVQVLRADFADRLPPLTHAPLDGMLFANSLHFSDRKLPVLTNLIRLLRPGGTVIIIEYNAKRGNGAVPYPMPDHACLQLMTAAGLEKAHIVTREPSSFLGEIYTARAAKPLP